MHDFRDEYEQFPMGQSEHLLDAFAQGPDFWDAGMGSEEIERQDAMVEDLMEERSITTGY
jgi:hypothetical protein